MQKLLKRTQTSPFRSVSSVSTIATTTLLSLSLGFSPPKTPLGSLLTFGMPQTMRAAAAPSGGSSLAAAGREAKTIRSPRFYLSTCRCASADFPSGDSLRFLAATGALSWRGRYCTVGGMDGTESGSVTAAAAAAAVEGLKGLEGEEDEGGEKGKRREKGSSEEKVGARLNRRQKGSSGDVEGNADLLTIPGVGPKNLRKLVEKGFRELAELKQFYKDKFLGKSNDTMVEYLQSSVGIIHRNHAESITNFIKESVDEELKDSSSDVKPVPKNRLTFCVEGNISVGKTTFLQRIVSDTIELRDLVEVVPEPIDKWQDIGPDHFNILDAFYAEPHRYAYTFQNYVFVTRVMQERESSGGVKPLRLMERSVFSDRMVFVRAVHEAKWMNEMEISIYDSWFDPVVSVLPGLIPDGFIYLRASPDTCHKRLKLRKRAEEGGVSLDYLRDLHEKHESWLLPFQSGNHGVVSVSKPLLLDNSLHPDIRGKVFYLEGDHMHSSIQKVPALVLDCEANIDLNRDTEAKEHYARQVTEFFKYVKTIKDVSSAKGSDVGIGKRQILLPREGGLLLPNGQHFPESALRSLDFSQALSFIPGQ